MTSANRKGDQSLLNLQTCVGAAAHATVGTEQLISHPKVSLVDTLFSLTNSEGGIIPVSEVSEILCKVHDNLDSAVSR